MYIVMPIAQLVVMYAILKFVPLSVGDGMIGFQLNSRTSTYNACTS